MGKKGGSDHGASLYFYLLILFLTNLAFFQDKIFDLAAKAEKPLAEVVPEATGWIKEASDALAPYAKEDWREWGREWLLPSLFVPQRSLNDRRVTSEEEKLTQRRRVEEEFSVALREAMDHEANETKRLGDMCVANALDMDGYQRLLEKLGEDNVAAVKELEKRRDQELSRLEDMWAWETGNASEEGEVALGKGKERMIGEVEEGVTEEVEEGAKGEVEEGATGEVGANDEGKEKPKRQAPRYPADWQGNDTEGGRYPALVRFVFLFLIILFAYYVYSAIGALWCCKNGTACTKSVTSTVRSVTSTGRIVCGRGRSEGRLAG